MARNVDLCVPSGFTLVEALIALFLLTTGVMAGALMQLQALRGGQQAKLHTSAVLLASDLAESMRLYADAAGGAGAASPFQNIDIDGDGGDAADASCLQPDANCSGVQWADFEIAAWSHRVRSQLPAARAVVCRDDAPWDAAAGAFVWRCSADPVHGALVIKLGWRGAGAHDDAPKVVVHVGSDAR